jgi:glutamine amidotransferase-like uncharacterized protein
MKSQRVIGIIVALALVMLVLAGPALAAPQSVHSPIRVAVYTSTGANSDKILATFRAVQSAGFSFVGVGRGDLYAGRLTTANYDVFVLPAGESDNKTVYASTDGLGSSTYKTAIQNFVNSGGGFVGIEGGAQYATNCSGCLSLYSGSYTRNGSAGKINITITDSGFGSGTQQVYRTAGGGYFALPSGATQVAKNSSNQSVIVRKSYGSGRVVLSSVDLELRGDSELDWTKWDNWAMGNSHTNSIGVWKLLGRMINFAATGTATEPTVTETPNPTGSRVAIVATHTTDGGAWAGLIPAVARAVEYSGHVPLAIRFNEIKNNYLTLSNFKVVIFPGGYSYGYWTGLSRYESKITSFANSGGGVMGICAGSYYLSDKIVWEGTPYNYPVNLFGGTDTGPLDGLNYPSYTLTTVNINDPVIGNLGNQQQFYYGGGYKTDLSASNATMVASYTVSGYNGYADAIRFMYGSGHVLLVGTHPEARSGSEDDWLSWDNFQENSNTPLTNPDNPWTFINAVLDNWLTQ